MLPCNHYLTNQRTISSAPISLAASMEKIYTRLFAVKVRLEARDRSRNGTEHVVELASVYY
jgi:hypothetical protein